MTTKLRIPAILTFVILFIGLGCNVSTSLTMEPTSTPTAPPPPTATTMPDTPSPEAETERVRLDPCSLLSATEVGEALGAPAEAQPDLGTGGCTFAVSAGDPAAAQFLTVSAAQGNEAKALSLLGLGLMAGFSQDPDLMTGFEALNGQVPDLTLVEVVDKSAALYDGTALNVSQPQGIGETALWLSVENEFMAQATLMVVREGAYVSFSLVGGNMETAQDELIGLIDNAFERLPPAFYVMDEAGEGDFTFSLGGDEESPEGQPGQAPGEFAEGLVWVVAGNNHKLLAIDPSTNAIVTTIGVGQFPSDILASEAGLLVVSSRDQLISQIDPVSFQVTATIDFSDNILFATEVDGELWVTGQVGLVAIDLQTGERRQVLQEFTHYVASGEGAIWVTQPGERQLLKIDASSGELLATRSLLEEPGNIAVAHGRVWVPARELDVVYGLDPVTLQTETRLEYRSPTWVYADDDYLWFVASGDIHYYNPATGNTRDIEPPYPANEVLRFGDSLWVSCFNSDRVLRIYAASFEVEEIELIGGPGALAATE